jgi:putative ABC transport system substrate-binding protein
MSPFVALSGHANGVGQCLLSGLKRTSPNDGAMSAYDPKRTSGLIQNNSGLPKDFACRDRAYSPKVGGVRPMFDMRRREFITLLGSAAASSLLWPRAACAQQAKGPVRIGFLPLGSPSGAYDRSLVEAFQEGLRKAGLVENRDIVLDIVWISGDPDEAVTELIQRGAQMLIPCGSSASVAAQRRAPTIPILFISVGNPIAMGLVESLSHPGRNATGFSDIQADLSGKLVDVARELRSPGSSVGYLWYTGWPDGENRYRATEQAAQSAGMKLQSRGIVDADEIKDAIAAIKNSGATTLIVQPAPFTFRHRDRIIDSAMNHRLGTIFGPLAAAREGGLIAYGPDQIHMYRAAPFYVDRILKGAKPADLPVQQATKVGLIVNLKTAKALGLEVPLALLIRADELIE